MNRTCSCCGAPLPEDSAGGADDCPVCRHKQTPSPLNMFLATGGNNFSGLVSELLDGHGEKALEEASGSLAPEAGQAINHTPAAALAPAPEAELAPPAVQPAPAAAPEARPPAYPAETEEAAKAPPPLAAEQEAAAASPSAAKTGQEPAEAVRPAPQDGQGPAWETPGSAWAGIIKTTGQMLFHPFRTMAAPAKMRSLWPLSYALVLCVFAACAQLLAETLITGNLNPENMLGAVFVGLLMAVPGLWILSAVIHGCLFILGGTRKGYKATLRAICYTQAVGVWLIVPAFGGLISFCWGLVCGAGGLAAAHGIGRGRALAAMLLPVLLLIMLLVGAAFFFGLARLNELLQAMTMDAPLGL